MQTTLTIEFYRTFFTALLLTMAVLYLLVTAALELYDLRHRRSAAPTATVHQHPGASNRRDGDHHNAA
ncbi:hypothetical protein [Streptomyces sp. KLOTTS4A1]|uniref:hypothetical protein n=1 Tax=Streptomyces sp. KLOTTS4A1 TaxID=3390996 RepID=UPI0039F615C5